MAAGCEAYELVEDVPPAATGAPVAFPAGVAGVPAVVPAGVAGFCAAGLELGGALLQPKSIVIMNRAAVAEIREVGRVVCISLKSPNFQENPTAFA